MIIPNFGFGGAQRVFSQLAQGLSERYNVIEVVFNNDEIDVYREAGIKISLNVNGGRNFFSKAVSFVKRCRRLHKLKKEYSCSLAISHLEGANFINILSFGPGKTILCVHGSKTAHDSNRKGLIKFIENRIFIPILFNLADKIVVVSAGISNELVKFFNIDFSKIKVIQNGIQVDEIRRLSREEIPDEFTTIFKKQVLVFSGRLAPQKNPVSLIDIYHKSYRQIDYHLLILGDGPLRSEMQDRCDELGLVFYDSSADNFNLATASIFFLGFDANPFRYLRRSDLFILTSNFEGFPLGPCEALACDMIVIATDCPTGVREVLSSNALYVDAKLTQVDYSDYGVLMPLIQNGSKYSELTDLWSDTIVKVFKDEDLKVLYRGRAHLRAAELSYHNFILHWMNLLNQILNPIS